MRLNIDASNELGWCWIDVFVSEKELIDLVRSHSTDLATKKLSKFEIEALVRSIQERKEIQVGLILVDRKRGELNDKKQEEREKNSKKPKNQD